jgi:hypothetical protein
MLKKRVLLKISFVLKAIAMAMGVASVGISLLKTGSFEKIGLLLGVGLACLAISTLND